MSLYKTYRWSVVVTIVALVVATLYAGATGLFACALLIVLEVSLSFDNAIVNATVLRRMSPKWQKAFLTWGILIAVFGMRLVFPIVIVAVAGGLGLFDVVDQALNDPDAYSLALNDAYPAIAAFGGAFLLMVFLSWILDPERDIHWLGPIERPLGKVGKLDSIAIVIAAAAVLATAQIVDTEHEKTVLVAGVAAIIVYVLVSSLSDLLDGQRQKAMAATVGQAGLASFLYLEVLDASFSFDGVIGAFAISQNVVVIALGLGVGALYVRSMTVHLVRAGTLRQYVFLEHGAHYAIGILAVILLISVELHISEVITGLMGAGIIIVSLIASILYNRRHPDRMQDEIDELEEPGPAKPDPDPLPAAGDR